MQADVAPTPDDRDLDLLAPVIGALGSLMRAYFRAEVRGMSNIPAGGALVVSNHSGGMLPMDIPVFASEFYRQFGLQREFYVLSHDALFRGPLGGIFRRCGLVPAAREAAHDLLEAGGVTMVFPGGDYDAARPFHQAGRIDFDGRTGYVRTALAARVPIVPVVSVGGQETQLFLSRGETFARVTGLRKLMRAKYMPISVGFPFGPSLGLPLNLPLPAKITTSVLPPVDLTSFGADPEVTEIDLHVRTIMQSELDRLSSERHLPVIG